MLSPLARIMAGIGMVLALASSGSAQEVPERLPAILSDVAAPLPAANDPTAEIIPEETAEEASGEDTSGFSWLTPKLWSSSWELGINGSEGNSQTTSIRTGGKVERATKRREMKAELIYNKASADGVETKNNGLFQARDEWLFPDSPWTLFTNFGTEYDEFRNFDVRLFLNAGVGYRLIRQEHQKLTSRFGAGVSRKIGGPENRMTPEALLGLDYEHQLTDKQKLALKSEYFPDWGDFNSYRLISELSWELILDEASNLSLKLGVIDRYDSTPDGRRPNDIDYSLLLLWKP